jgi:hypothetical protein
MTAATDLGYRPVGDYAATVVEEIDWLVRTARAEPGSLPGPENPNLGPMLEYAAEDEYLAKRVNSAR